MRWGRVLRRDGDSADFAELAGEFCSLIGGRYERKIGSLWRKENADDALFHRARRLEKKEEELLLNAVRSQNLFGKSGAYVAEFERQFAEFYGVGYAQSSTSGTAAIHLAVGVVDPEPGDEIITAPITDPGSVMPILIQNAVPCVCRCRSPHDEHDARIHRSQYYGSHARDHSRAFVRSPLQY